MVRRLFQVEFDDKYNTDLLALQIAIMEILRNQFPGEIVSVEYVRDINETGIPSRETSSFQSSV